MKAFLAAALFAASIQGNAFAQGLTEDTQVAFAGCGWFVVLGCERSYNGAAIRMNSLGGPYAGGGAGLSVADTNDFPNFRNGYYCTVDGPYATERQAKETAWTEALPAAYVKGSC